MLDDDVAVKDSLYTAGRRGVGATVLAEKICGAAAEEGRPLAEVAGLCRTVNERSRSMGVALTSCTTPMAGKPTFDLDAADMEVGVGIHGEPGRERALRGRPTRSSRDLATAVVDDLPFAGGDRVLAFVNGMGGTPLMELYIVYAELHTLPPGPRHRRRPQPDRLLRHLAGHGRVLAHAAATRRRAHRGSGTRPWTRPDCGGAA